MTTRTEQGVPLDEAEEEALIAASNKLVGEELEEYTRLVDRLKLLQLLRGPNLRALRELLGRAQRDGRGSES